MGRPAEETVRLWRCADLPGVDLLHAGYVTQSFGWHSHDTFSFGAVERGGLAFRFRGVHEVAPAGCVTLALPGEGHTGHGADRTGWQYRMFYIDPALLLEAAAELAPERRGFPPILPGVLDDPPLAAAIATLHRRLAQNDGTPLERQEALAAILARFVRVHARWGSPPPPAPRAAQRARGYLEEHVAEAVSLAQLAEAARCSPFRLVRAFRDTFGLPPHAYHLQMRVRRGQELLRRGWLVAHVAAELGFVDQSHFTRVFRAVAGMTPGTFARGHRS